MKKDALLIGYARVSKADDQDTGSKTAADAARLFGVHRSTIGRLLARAKSLSGKWSRGNAFASWGIIAGYDLGTLSD